MENIDFWYRDLSQRMEDLEKSKYENYLNNWGDERKTWEDLKRWRINY